MAKLDYTRVTLPFVPSGPDQMIRSLADQGQDQFSIEQIQPSARELADLHRDEKTIALTPTMPMSLIQPIKLPPADGSGRTMTSDDDERKNSDVAPPSDCISGIAWGVQAVQAHISAYRGCGAVVAVLDTGIQANHPAFKGLHIVQENFTQDASAVDGNGHGTHCAGTIAGRDVEGLRIGVAPDIDTLLIGKVLSDSGQGSTTGIVKGIHWASLNGAHIISMSLGIDFPGYVDTLHKVHGYELKAAVSQALQAYSGNVEMFHKLGDSLSALSYIGQGSLVVAAAGNESRRPDYTIGTSPPAVASSIISVAALDQQLAAAPFSNTFADISAPGVQISSAGLDSDLSVLSGTSMAAPHVAGVAALWCQKLMESESRIGMQRLRNAMFDAVSASGLSAGLDPENTGKGLVTAPIA